MIRPWNSPGKTRIFRLDEYNSKDKLLNDDTPLLQALAEEIENWHVLSGYYSRSFDIPFLRARMMATGVKPPSRILHVDWYWQYARKHLPIHSRRMGSVGTFLTGKSAKTLLDCHIWVNAQVLDKRAMDYVANHCVMDCFELDRITKTIPNREWMPKTLEI